MRTKPAKIRRQIFVFTADEKRTALCVVAMFALGLGTMRYRAAYPQPPRLSERQQYQADRATKAAKAYARSAHGQRAARAKVAVAQTNPAAASDLDGEDDD